jgi:hypothetical protein
MKANVDIRLTSPIGTSAKSISGLDELFYSSTYRSQTSYRLVICSPWLEVAPLSQIVRFLDKSVSHQLYILTFRAHSSTHLSSIKTYLAGLYQKPFGRVVVGYLPTRKNPKNLRSDILHAKMYFLLENPPAEITDESSGLKEAFFGSANFTMNGTGRGGSSAHASNRKFEVVARIEDSSGRKSLWDEFLRIWWNCDEEDFNGANWLRKVRYK